MKNNQFTIQGETVNKNLNMRVPGPLRERMDALTKKHRVTRADIMRAALERYLPLLEGQTVTEAPADGST